MMMKYQVQINRADIAKVFAKVKSPRVVGYSVCGNYLRVFHVKQSVRWVEAWMKEFVRHANAGLAEPKEN